MSRSDFGKAVKDHQADKGVRNLSTFDFFKMMVYGQLTGCFSVQEIENSLRANASKLYHSGLPLLKRSAFLVCPGGFSASVFFHYVTPFYLRFLPNVCQFGLPFHNVQNPSLRLLLLCPPVKA
ncbi:MAG: DUF4372 domain-containing protein [Treponema sp.]|nr:DUF4372 domain-containing protein [Treponema sp.]